MKRKLSKLGRSTVSVLLCLVMLLTTFCFFDIGSVISEALISKSSHALTEAGNDSNTFAQDNISPPELVYIKPGGRDSDIFLNATSTGTVSEITSDTSTLSFSCATARSVVITMTLLDTNLDATTANIVSEVVFTDDTYFQTNEALSSSSSSINKTIKRITMFKSEPGKEYVVRWNIVYTTASGTYTTYAYTGIKFPLLSQAGMTTRQYYFGTSGGLVNNPAESATYSFITGVDAVKGGNDGSKWVETGSTRTAPLINFNASLYPRGLDMPISNDYFDQNGTGVLTAFAKKGSNNVYFGQGSRIYNTAWDTPGSKTYNPMDMIQHSDYFGGKPSTDGDAWGYAAADITIDTSRYSDFNQVPNLSVGFVEFDSDGANDKNYLNAIRNSSYTTWDAADYFRNNRTITNSAGKQNTAPTIYADVDRGDEKNDRSWVRGLYKLNGNINTVTSNLKKSTSGGTSLPIATYSGGVYTTYMKFEYTCRFNPWLKSDEYCAGVSVVKLNAKITNKGTARSYYYKYLNSGVNTSASNWATIDGYVKSYVKALCVSSAVAGSYTDPASAITTAQTFLKGTDGMNTTTPLSPPLYFYVPEAVYLTPQKTSWSVQTRSSFQYFIQNDISDPTNPKTKTSRDTSGTVYFNYPNATNVSIKYRWMTMYGAVMSSSSSSTSTYYNSNSYINFAGSTLYSNSAKTISLTDGIGTFSMTTSGYSPYLSASDKGCFIEWTVTYTDTIDGYQKTAIAYTYVYKPYTVPVGGGVRNCNTGGSDHYGSILTWISGFHSATADTSSSGYYPRYARADSNYGASGFLTNSSSGYLTGVSGAVSNGTMMRMLFGSATASASWFRTNANASYGDPNPDAWMTTSYSSSAVSGNNTTYNVKTFNYLNSEDGKNSTDTVNVGNQTVTAKANIYIDTSRYSNLNQIPNLGVGFMVVDNKDADNAAWYIADFTDKSPGYTGTTGRFDDDDDVRRRMWETHGTIIARQGPDAYSNGMTSGSYNSEGMKYAGTWPSAVAKTTGSKVYQVKSHLVTDDGHSSDICNSATIIKMNATLQDKTDLRKAVKRAQNNFPNLGIYNADTMSSYYYSGATYTNFVNTYKNAYRELTRLDGDFTSTSISSLVTSLDNYIDALTTGTDIKGTAANDSCYAREYNLGLEKLSNGQYKIVEIKGGKQYSTTYNARDNVYFTPDTYEGYTFAGKYELTSFTNGVEDKNVSISPSSYYGKTVASLPAFLSASNLNSNTMSISGSTATIGTTSTKTTTVPKFDGNNTTYEWVAAMNDTSLTIVNFYFVDQNVVTFDVNYDSNKPNLMGAYKMASNGGFSAITSSTTNGVTTTYNRTTGEITLNGSMSTVQDTTIFTSLLPDDFAAGTYTLKLTYLGGSITGAGGNFTVNPNESSSYLAICADLVKENGSNIDSRSYLESYGAAATVAPTTTVSAAQASQAYAIKYHAIPCATVGTITNITFNSYKIKLEYVNSSNGTTGFVPNSLIQFYGHQLGTMPVPERANHRFLGWFTAPDGGTRVTASTVMGNSDMTVYAHWALTDKTVLLDNEFDFDEFAAKASTASNTLNNFAGSRVTRTAGTLNGGSAINSAAFYTYSVAKDDVGDTSLNIKYDRSTNSSSSTNAAYDIFKSSTFTASTAGEYTLNYEYRVNDYYSQLQETQNNSTGDAVITGFATASNYSGDGAGQSYIENKKTSDGYEKVELKRSFNAGDQFFFNLMFYFYSDTLKVNRLRTDLDLKNIVIKDPNGNIVLSSNSMITERGSSSYDLDARTITLKPTGTDCYTNTYSSSQLTMKLDPGNYTFMFDYQASTNARLLPYIFTFESEASNAYQAKAAGINVSAGSGTMAMQFTVKSDRPWIRVRFGVDNYNGSSTISGPVTFGNISVQRTEIYDTALGGYNSDSSTYLGWISKVTSSTNEETAAYVNNLTSRNEKITAHYQDLEYGSKFDDLYVPTREGYTFLGWYNAAGTRITDANGNSVVNSTITDTTKLYSRWVPEDFRLMYENELDFDKIECTDAVVGDGSYKDIVNVNRTNNSLTIDGRDVEWGSLTKLYTRDSGNGYGIPGSQMKLIKGHTYEVSFDVENIGSNSTTGFVLYSWCNSDGTYKDYSGDSGSNGVTVAAGEKKTFTETITVHSAVTTAVAIMKLRFEISGSDSARTAATFSNICVRDLTDPMNYKASDSQNPSLSKKFDFVTYNKKASSLATITRQGYTFKGWYQSQNTSNGNGYGTQFTTSTVMPFRDVPLYAQWALNNYNIVINLNADNTDKASIATISYKQASNNASTGAISTTDATMAAQKDVVTTIPTIGAAYGTNVSIPKPERSGYTFTGWTASSNPAYSSFTKSTTGTSTYRVGAGAETITANWSRNSYPVKAYAYGDIFSSAEFALGRGGTVQIASDAAGTSVSKNIAYRSTTTLKATAATGYAFVGWYTDPGLTNLYSTNPSITSESVLTAGRTYYAKFKVQSYKITINPDNATTGSTISGWYSEAGKAASSQTIKTSTTITMVYGSKVTMTVPQKTGYTFKGWSRTAGTTGTLTSSTTGNSTFLCGAGDATVTAQWQINPYTITLHALANKFDASAYTENGLGGTVQIDSNAASNKNTSKTYNYNTKYTIKAAAYTGYKFEGWYTPKDGNNFGTLVSTSTSYTTTLGASNITYYAKFSVMSYNITINPNGATGGTNLSGWYSAPGTLATAINGVTASRTIKMVYGSKLTMTAPSRSGYTFTGWLRTSGTTGTLNSSTTGNSTYLCGAGDATLTAQWTPYFDLNWYFNDALVGTGYSDRATATVSVNGTAVATNVNDFYGAIAPGSTIKIDVKVVDTAGWHLGEPASGSYTMTMPSGPSSYSPKLYSKYKVVFNGNGNTGGSTATQNFVWGTAQNLNANGFTKSGFEFKSWNTKADGTGTTYSNQQSVNKLTDTPNGTVTLYAQWTPCLDLNWDFNDTRDNDGDSTKATATISINGTVVATNVADYYGAVAAGSKVKITVTAKDGWHIATANPMEFNMPNSYYAAIPKLYSKYKVVFNGNGNTGGSTATQYFVWGTAQNLNANGFTRTGYTFDGWATSATGSVVYSDRASVNKLTDTPNGTVNLYAHWKINPYSIKVHSKSNKYNNVTTYAEDTVGGTVQINTTPASTSTILNYGTEYSITATAKTGYQFVAWYSDAALTKQVSTSATYSTTLGAANIEYYAKFNVRTYTITIDPNSPTTGSNISGWYDYNDYKTTPAPVQTITKSTSITMTYGSTVTMTAPKKTGYTFGGWKLNGSGTLNSTADTTKNSTYTCGAGSGTVTAIWNINTFTINYNGNGSNAGTKVPPQTFTYNVAQKLNKNTFERKYTITFNGNGGTIGGQAEVTDTAVWTSEKWNNKADGTGGYTYKDTASVTNPCGLTEKGASATLYAQWEGGSLNLKTAERTGYVFLGWALTDNAEIPTYTVNQSVNFTKDTTFFAVWVETATAQERVKSIDVVSGITIKSNDLNVEPIVKTQKKYFFLNNADYTKACEAYEEALKNFNASKTIDNAKKLVEAVKAVGSYKTEDFKYDAPIKKFIREFEIEYASGVTGTVKSGTHKLSDLNLNHYTKEILSENADSILKQVKLAEAVTSISNQSTINEAVKNIAKNYATKTKLSTTPTYKVYENSAAIKKILSSSEGIEAVNYVRTDEDNAVYYCYANTTNPKIYLEVEDAMTSQNRLCYPTRSEVSAGAVDSVLEKTTSTVKANFVRGTKTVDNSTYTTYLNEGLGNTFKGTVNGKEFTGASYYKQKSTVELSPVFTENKNGAAEYVLTSTDDSYNSASTTLGGNYASTASLSAGLNSGKDFTGSTKKTVTIVIDYHSGAGINVEATQVPGDYYLNQFHLLRTSGGARNWELPQMGDTKYTVDHGKYTYTDSNGKAVSYSYEQCGYGSFTYTFTTTSGSGYSFDFNNCSAAIPNGNNPSSVDTKALTNEMVKKLAPKVNKDGSLNCASLNEMSSHPFKGLRNNNKAGIGYQVWGTNWSYNYYPASNAFTYVHIVDRWGNVYDNVFWVGKLDYDPAQAKTSSTEGSYTILEDGGSGIDTLSLNAEKMEILTDENSSLENNVYKTTGNTIRIRTGEAKKSYTLSMKDKATNASTATVTSDENGIITLIIEDTAYESGVYTFMLNGTQINLYSDKYILKVYDGEAEEGEYAELRVVTTAEVGKVRFTDTDGNTITVSSSTANEDGTKSWSMAKSRPAGEYQFSITVKIGHEWIKESSVGKLTFTERIYDSGLVRSAEYDAESGLYRITIEGRATKIQFVSEDGMTRTYTRYNDSVKSIKTYDEDGNEVNDTARTLDSEVWLVSARIYSGQKYTVAGKFEAGWNREGTASLTAH